MSESHSGKKTVAISGAVGFVLGVLVTLAFMQGGDPGLVLAIAPAPDGATHLAIDGKPVLCKAVLQPSPGRLLNYSWDFSDGSDPVEGIVTDPYAVSVIHQFPQGPIGTRHVATLTIIDTASHQRATGKYVAEVVEPTLDNKVTIALDDAVWALHASMTREEHPVHGSIGYWSPRDHPVGTTAMCALAFCVNGFDMSGSRSDNPYRDTVERSLRYVLSGCEKTQIEAQPAGDPDSNDNGFGLTVAGSKRSLYELPLVAMALVASRESRVATSGGEGVIGRRYEDLVTDMLDFIAFAQGEGEGAQRGGWRYTANYRGADMSVTQWPVLAIMSAREVWGLDSPDWVRTELRDGFLVKAQGADGAFGYERAGDRQNIRLTGAGLISLAFTGMESSDQQVQNAADYIAAHWAEQNVGDYYAMYAVMKGAKLSEPPIEKFGEHDWHTEYGEHLVGRQNQDGTWPGDGSWGKGVLATAWPALVLSKDIFAAGRPISILWTVVAPGISLLALVLLGLLFLRRRNLPAPAGSAADTEDSPDPAGEPE